MPTVNKEPIAILPGSDSEFELDIRVSTIRIETTPSIQNGVVTKTCNTNCGSCNTCNTCSCSCHTARTSSRVCCC